MQTFAKKMPETTIFIKYFFQPQQQNKRLILIKEVKK